MLIEEIGRVGKAEISVLEFRKKRRAQRVRNKQSAVEICAPSFHHNANIYVVISQSAWNAVQENRKSANKTTRISQTANRVFVIIIFTFLSLNSISRLAFNSRLNFC